MIPMGLRYGEVFTFTRDDFKQYLNSSIDDYDLAHGVMGSAAFPGVFSFVTLQDFRACDTNTGLHYLHVFDGGNADNLGLESAKKTSWPTATATATSLSWRWIRMSPSVARAAPRPTCATALWT